MATYIGTPGPALSICAGNDKPGCSTNLCGTPFSHGGHLTPIFDGRLTRNSRWSNEHVVPSSRQFGRY